MLVCSCDSKSKVGDISRDIRMLSEYVHQDFGISMICSFLKMPRIL